MPLTKEQARRVRHEVDHAGLVNRVSCKQRIKDLSTELQCDEAAVKNLICNHQRKQKGQGISAHTSSEAVQEAIQPDEQLETTSIPEQLCELDKIVVLKPRKMRIAATERFQDTSCLCAGLGRTLKDETDANKLRKAEDSQAELIQMKDFQMTDSNPGACSKWAVLSESERDSYNEMARMQTLANKDSSMSVQKSDAEIQEAQRKSYFIMVSAIKNFVKNSGTHIGTSRLPYESETKNRIKTIALGDMAEQAVRHAAKGEQQYQQHKVLAYLDIRQNIDPKNKIIARAKPVGSIQARRATFQGDLFRKFQVFRPDAKNVPVTELRQGKTQIDWPNAVKKTANFTLEELDILERNQVQLVKSAEDDDKEASSASLETDQESPATSDQTNGSQQSHDGIDLNLAAGEMEAALVAAGFTGCTQFKTPAYSENGQSAGTTNFDEIDFEALSSIIGMQSCGG
ncbi:hypothetical protein BJ741DRAFT_707636 [Chytriomyces cf. hyalinus JEL632]|nr:hypothetical protein BJ741DRAFT_707636 [Chytriomyces cf. hyalinus JEL632]